MPDLDKLQRDDHDTLIRLETKVDVLSTEVKSYSDKVNTTLNEYGNRITRLELWKHDFEIRWKMVLGVASIVGATVGVLVNAIATYLGIHR